VVHRSLVLFTVASVASAGQPHHRPFGSSLPRRKSHQPGTGETEKDPSVFRQKEGMPCAALLLLDQRNKISMARRRLRSLRQTTIAANHASPASSRACAGAMSHMRSR